jgi:hypothetical protein
MDILFLFSGINFSFENEFDFPVRRTNIKTQRQFGLKLYGINCDRRIGLLK